MRENSALQAWRGGGQTIGGWLSIGNAYTAEVMSGMGFDWLCVDLQHGMLSYDDLTYMLPAISTQDTIPFVRVPWNEPYEIMKALDAGAYGVIVPMVNNAEEAAQAVAACRYPPDGNRSFGPIRAALYGGRGYAAEANGQIACIAMVETAEGIDKLDEIAATPGLDAIYIGPSDLGYALGLGPAAFDDPLHVETVGRIFAACRDTASRPASMPAAWPSPASASNRASTSSPWAPMPASWGRPRGGTWPRPGRARWPSVRTPAIDGGLAGPGLRRKEQRRWRTPPTSRFCSRSRAMSRC